MYNYSAFSCKAVLGCSVCDSCENKAPEGYESMRLLVLSPPSFSRDGKCPVYQPKFVLNQRPLSEQLDIVMKIPLAPLPTIKWILLAYYNDYDQHGGYFCGVFDSKEEAEAASPNGRIGRNGEEGMSCVWYEVMVVEEGKYVEQVL